MANHSMRLPSQEGEKPTPTSSSHRSIAGMIPDTVRNHLVAMLGEFVGTFLFLFFAFAGTQTANTPRSTTGNQSTDLPTGPNPLVILYISLSFAVSLSATVWIFYRISGGQFNPAVTVALYLTSAIPFSRALLLIPTQLLGSIASAFAVKTIYPGPLAVTTTLNGSTSKPQGLFIEMFLTAQLVLTILMLAVEKHRATFLAPLGIGMSLFVAELAGVYYTGGSLNPARSFGPAVASYDFPNEHWVYWAGPMLGALLASGFYWVVRLLRYEGANPGQDGERSVEEALVNLLVEELNGRGGRKSSFGRPLSLTGSAFQMRAEGREGWADSWGGQVRT